MAGSILLTCSGTEGFDFYCHVRKGFVVLLVVLCSWVVDGVALAVAVAVAVDAAVASVEIPLPVLC